MTLAELVARRLRLAGFQYDDPALLATRQWNAAVYARHAGRVPATRSQRDKVRGKSEGSRPNGLTPGPQAG